MADVVSIAVPVAALGPLLSLVGEWIRGRKTRRLEKRIETLEASERDCVDRLMRAYERAGRLAATQVSPFAPPEAIPEPDWDEKTPLRAVRIELERKGFREAVDEILQKFVNDKDL